MCPPHAPPPGQATRPTSAGAGGHPLPPPGQGLSLFALPTEAVDRAPAYGNASADATQHLRANRREMDPGQRTGLTKGRQRRLDTPKGKAVTYLMNCGKALTSAEILLHSAPAGEIKRADLSPFLSKYIARGHLPRA